MKAWLDAGQRLDTLSVNLSPRQFERPDICERIAAIVGAAGLPFDKLEVEITESVLMGQKDAAGKIRTLRDLGLRVSVDDFGTGHSSLAYLKNFPIHKLKLDRAFIVDIPGDATGMEIAAAVIRLGHSLDLDVLAEVRANVDVPVAAYHVSGEYAMVKAAAERGWIDGPAVALEQITAIKRAGADFVLTYFAAELAEALGG